MSTPENFVKLEFNLEKIIQNKSPIIACQKCETFVHNFRGEIKIILINHGAETFSVGNGDRVAQMVVCRVARARFDLVDELDGTDRGSGGFGHTGV